MYRYEQRVALTGTSGVEPYVVSSVGYRFESFGTSLD